MVKIFDPVAMERINHGPGGEAPSGRVPIPAGVRSLQHGLDCAAMVARQKAQETQGQVPTAQYEDLGEKAMFGVSVHGCRITRKLQTQELSSTTEIWRSAELEISLLDVTRFGNGREDLQQVESLRREGAGGGDVCRFRRSSRDQAAPLPRTNMNPNLDLLAESGAVEWHDGLATLNRRRGRIRCRMWRTR